MMAYCDSNYARDKDGRKSLNGFGICILGCLDSWKSRSQKLISLFLTKAEYVSISELCAEIMVFKQILDFLGIQVALPIIVKMENVGAIY